MTPETAFALLNLALDLIKRVRAESGMTDEQLAAYADKQDLQNKDDIKSLLAL